MAAENINRRLNIYINDKEVVNSMGGITRGMTQTRNAIRNLEKGTEDYDEKLKALKETYKKLSDEQSKFKAEIAETPSLLQKIKGSLGPVASGMIAAFSVGAIANKAMDAFNNAKKVINDFEQSVADLSAITGATGKDLEFLKNKAIDLGQDTKGGAVAVVEAYKLIASAKPELLSNVEALNQVTEATLLLAKASGMDVPQAATKLTDAMNQFNAPASEASKYVDVLAAGAKYGAAEIPQLTDAVLAFGAVAKVSNVDIKESVALSELLAEKGQKGSEAGTKIRNILLQVMSGGNSAQARQELEKYGISIEDLKNKSIPFAEKLESLKPLLKDVGSVTQVFGTENATAAISLIENTNRLKELTSQVGEYGVAEQQAAIKMDTVTNKTILRNAKYDSLILSINKGTGIVSNFFKFLIDGESNALTGLIRLNSSWDELNAKAKGEGQKSGVGAFQSRFNNLQGTGSDADIAKSIKTVAERDYKAYKKAYDENEKLVKEHEGEKAYLGLFGEAGASKRAKAEKENLIKNLNEQATIIREANKKINPIKSTTTTGGETATGGSPIDTKASDAAAKKRQKNIDDAKKNAEDQLKIENDLQKALIDSQAKADELKSGLIKDDYERERAIINTEYDKKIEDIQLNLKKEQEAIDKLKSGIADPKISSESLVSYKKQLADRIEIQKNYNEILIDTNKTRDLKLGTLQEKFLQKNIQDQEKDNAKALQNLHTKQNNELAGITTLEQAKALLSETLSANELAKIKTLEDAKKAIKKKHLDEEYDLQLNYLNSITTEYKNLLDGQTVDGFKILTSEQRDEILANLDAVKNKISEISLSSSNNAAPVEKTQLNLSSLSGIDILGFTAEQWDGAFSQLDTFDGKMQALQTTIGGVQNAFGMYFQFIDAGEKKKLQRFEANTKKQHAELSNQLEKGAITQEVYNARSAKLDADLAKKKAELEYKQAKRDKIMKVGSIVANTAMGIMQIWGHSPDPTGISQGLLTAIISGIGLAQLGLVLAQPLPDKNGFYDGGYTGSGNERNSPGPVHYDEYVVPKKVLFSNDPVVPNIVGYLEAKRTGKQPMTPQDQSNVSSARNQGSSGSSQTDMQVVNALNRNSNILEKIEEEGIQSYLINDYKTAKKMRDKIKEVTKNETNAKP
jgi:TP901 family phage tail tape measure protein